MTYELTFTLHSDWHIGSGEEGGSYADALVAKSAQGLPYIPGKSIKGLLRHAFETAAQHNWFGEHGEDVATYLFGHEGKQAECSQGVIQLSSAELSRAEQQFLTFHKSHQKYLYRVLQSTAVNERGVARNTSLRATQVVVPVTLVCELTFNHEHPNWARLQTLLTEAELVQCIDDALLLITELGGKRQRGFGQVTVTLNKEAA
ncbi:RAMP superfamily CRISPR-associated protein [Pseudoalteromonas sp. R3]|uniref:RAMP superfamily CRISPR-associated protein n=1 Tax=Pseudoalteromonas sp. R3 TaxID=1709477 RepID=UPI0006B4C81E|nr:RAMP superfamily CRISPR-associated protein [Pseudoalteromonas sp. R3]AZZ97516.1 hypothetical protein ELR70_10510 [Pseudoalteromonas sp. R3]